MSCPVLSSRSMQCPLPCAVLFAALLPYALPTACPLLSERMLLPEALSACSSLSSLAMAGVSTLRMLLHSPMRCPMLAQNSLTLEGTIRPIVLGHVWCYAALSDPRA
eukprot:3190258-Rhodomonas_salina.1